MSDPTQRFGNRSSDYAKYRPSYPGALFDDLDLAPTSTVADVGAGTGLFTRLLAKRVGLVYALEPNAAMRDQGRADSQGFERIVWQDATGESTGLGEATLDGLFCAQAFHWLDRARVGVEWRRVLKAGAPVVLVWNERDEGSALQDAYEALLNRWCPEYPKVNHRNLSDEVIEGFFSPAPVEKRVYRNDQRFDLEGFRGRLRSASYCPPPGKPGHDEAMEALGPLFEAHASDGLLTFPYVTKVFVGRFG